MKLSENLSITIVLEDEEIAVASGLFAKLKYEPVKIGLTKAQITESEQSLIDTMCDWFGHKPVDDRVNVTAEKDTVR